MSYQKRGFFTILNQVSESSLKIQENVPESVEEVIEIAQSSTTKTEDKQPVILLKTTQGRQFLRLEEWPKNLLLEVQQS
jgi:hypothetical protein